MAEVKVLGFKFSPYVNKVEMALKMKGVEFEYIEEDLKNKSPLLLEYNPVHKKVPILVHQGKAIAESDIILEYIDEVWGTPPLLPKDPYERAMARFWLNFIGVKCIPTMWKACWSKGEEQEKMKEEATQALKFLENEIKGKRFFGGNSIGIVDLGASFIAYWVPIISEISGVQLITLENHPNLSRWAEEYCNDSFIKENLPNKDEMVRKINADVVLR